VLWATLLTLSKCCDFLDKAVSATAYFLTVSATGYFDNSKCCDFLVNAVSATANFLTLSATGYFVNSL
jgi:hypothetical protein